MIHRTEISHRANALGISQAALELYCASDVIDLHVDTFIWNRVFGYDLWKTHGYGALRGNFYSQTDLPRARAAGLTGATWIITTNPLRSAASRTQTFVRNLQRLKETLSCRPGEVSVVRSAREYRAARARSVHGAFIGVQGGNALDESLEALDRIPDGDVLRITLVHLTNSKIGTTSSPLSQLRGFRRHRSRIGASEGLGLSDFGREYVRRLNEKRIFVDLAHISRQGFFDVVEVHDPTQPLLVTHTGVCGVHDHWRNLTDKQLRAIADTGGTVGVMFHRSFLGNRDVSVETVVDHLAHIIRVIGEEHASIGSDFDGAIRPPPDLATLDQLPRLVDAMLRRGWSPDRIRKVLGENFLRVVQELRG